MLIFIIFILITATVSENIRHERQVFQAPEQDLDKFIQEQYEPLAQEVCKLQMNAMWNFVTDVDNEEKQNKWLEESLNAALFSKQFFDLYFQLMTPNGIKNESLRRKIVSLTRPGNAALNEDELGEMMVLINNMTTLYSAAKICPYSNQQCDIESEGLSLQPDIENIMANSTDPDELTYAWKAWRDVTGAKIKPLYKIYLQMSNDAAKANKFSNQAELWKSVYETPDFEDVLERVWLEVKPLYDELHKYVLNKLRKHYHNNNLGEDGLIPAHLLGNMWAQNWVSLSKSMRPFPNATASDVTAALNKQGYTVLKMFQIADEFYQSLGMEPAAESYDVNAGAMIEKPANREVQCYPSAWDFCDGKNYRIKMCAEVNFRDFLTAHRELGHIHYYMLYRHQPITLREGANPGFQEAVGNAVALSVATRRHLQKIGLLKDYEDGNVEVDDKVSSLNALMDMALEKVAFLPFGLLVDKWRWDVFSGKVSQEDWNSHWWKYREQYQKVKPPVERTEKDFDPGSKYHIISDTQFIPFFIAQILEFQLYKGLCIAAGEYDAMNGSKLLHECDFYQSATAGEKLKEGLSLGSSRHWSEVLQKITGEAELSGAALMEYFNPLYEFLKSENENSV